jgi:hypothetical protein
LVLKFTDALPFIQAELANFAKFSSVNISKLSRLFLKV